MTSSVYIIFPHQFALCDHLTSDRYFFVCPPMILNRVSPDIGLIICALYPADLRILQKEQKCCYKIFNFNTIMIRLYVSLYIRQSSKCMIVTNLLL